MFNLQSQNQEEKNFTTNLLNKFVANNVPNEIKQHLSKNVPIENVGNPIVPEHFGTMFRSKAEPKENIQIALATPAFHDKHIDDFVNNTYSVKALNNFIGQNIYLYDA